MENELESKLPSEKMLSRENDGLQCGCAFMLTGNFDK